MPICTGITKSGNKCKNKISKGEKCYLHKYQNIKTKSTINNNQECPICYEEKHLIIFKCTHGTCRECLKKFDKCQCPICRSDIKSSIDYKTVLTIMENKIINDQQQEQINNINDTILAITIQLQDLMRR